MENGGLRERSKFKELSQWCLELDMCSINSPFSSFFFLSFSVLYPDLKYLLSETVFRLKYSKWTPRATVK